MLVSTKVCIPTLFLLLFYIFIFIYIQTVYMIIMHGKERKSGVQKVGGGDRQKVGGGGVVQVDHLLCKM